MVFYPGLIQKCYFHFKQQIKNCICPYEFIYNIHLQDRYSKLDNNGKQLFPPETVIHVSAVSFLPAKFPLKKKFPALKKPKPETSKALEEGRPSSRFREHVRKYFLNYNAFSY